MSTIITIQGYAFAGSAPSYRMEAKTDAGVIAVAPMGKYHNTARKAYRKIYRELRLQAKGVDSSISSTIAASAECWTRLPSTNVNRQIIEEYIKSLS